MGSLDPALIRAVCLLLPLALTLALFFWLAPDARTSGALLLTLLWNVVGLLGLNFLAMRVGWWGFAVENGAFWGVPVDLWLGWSLLWGPLVLLAFPRAALWMVVLGLLLLDLAFMPRLRPVLQLGPNWLLGECLGLMLVLPAQLLGRWTCEQRVLAGRAFLQVILFSALMLLSLLVAMQSGSPGGLTRPLAWFVFWGALMLPAVVLALVAVLEFVQRGCGTPFPWDAPTVLVESGPYMFVANPMQLGATLLLLLLSLSLEHVWVSLAALMAVIFGIGLGSWSEHADLQGRFSARWQVYASRVRRWLPAWCPRVGLVGQFSGPALWVDWLRLRRPIGLDLYPVNSAWTYQSGAHTDTGWAALGRALEHINLGWALLGWTLRLLAVLRFK